MAATAAAMWADDEKFSSPTLPLTRTLGSGLKISASPGAHSTISTGSDKGSRTSRSRCGETD